MNWILLIVAGLFEVGFATCLGKARENSGTTATWWLLGFLICLSISMFLLYKATKTLPIGTSYAVWTGIGTEEQYCSVGLLFLKNHLTFGGCFL